MSDPVKNLFTRENRLIKIYAKGKRVSWSRIGGGYEKNVHATSALKGVFFFFFYLFTLPSRKVYAAGDNNKLNVPATIFVSQPGLPAADQPLESFNFHF